MTLRDERDKLLAAGPGPVERSRWARLHFRLLGYWPKAVARERLAAIEELREAVDIR
jgi:hypothetical protein